MMVRKFCNGFLYAWTGFVSAFVTQRNMKVHAVAAIAVLSFGLVVGLPQVDFLFVLVAIALVLSAELMNTAAEHAVDLAMPAHHPKAKIAKDAAAAAVLITALFAICVAVVVFYNPLRLLLTTGRFGVEPALTTSINERIAAWLMLVAIVAAVCFAIFQPRSRRHDSQHRLQPQRSQTSQPLPPYSASQPGIGHQPRTESDLRTHPQAKQWLQLAVSAREFSYSPYSRFKVGSVVVASDGTVYAGCNIENAAYGPSNCAERTALFRAIADGCEPGSFTALAVVGDTAQPIVPCGVCRQVMAELCPPDMPVVLGNLAGDFRITTVGELLPNAFTQANLLAHKGEKK